VCAGLVGVATSVGAGIDGSTLARGHAESVGRTSQPAPWGSTPCDPAKMPGMNTGCMRCIQNTKVAYSWAVWDREMAGNARQYWSLVNLVRCWPL
jgi:hypothetical protein